MFSNKQFKYQICQLIKVCFDFRLSYSKVYSIQIIMCVTFTNVTHKIWPLKIVSKHSSSPLTPMDFPIIINDTFYVNIKKIKI